MPLEGYARIPGSAGRYRTPDGGSISRRQYENRRVQAETPFKTYSEYRRAVKLRDREYNNFSGEAKFLYYSKAWSAAKGVSVEEARQPDSMFSLQYARISNEGWHRGVYRAWADLLRDIGWKEDFWWNVGDTPKAGGSE